MHLARLTFNYFGRISMTVPFRAIVALTALGWAGVAAAEPDRVIVGSVDPQSKQVTVFESLLSRKFADGGAVTRIYGGYSAKSNKYHLVRAGKSASGSCLTEVFQLARLSGNRLALAVSPSGQAWNPNILQQLGVTFDCQSRDCFSCDPDHGIPDFGEEPGCTCGTPTDVGEDEDGDIVTIHDIDPGVCIAARPGTSSYSYRQLMAPGTQVGSEG
jgi:hypothetical protein